MRVNAAWLEIGRIFLESEIEMQRQQKEATAQQQAQAAAAPEPTVCPQTGKGKTNGRHRRK